MSNILLLPLVLAGIEVATNEDWVDGVMFVNKSTGVPIDLTGISFSFMVRRRLTDATAILSGSTEDGRLISGGVGGTLNFNVMAVDMEQLQQLEGVYDVRAYAGVNKRRVMTGALVITLGVDRTHDVPDVVPGVVALRPARRILV
jgi:hypothetical protein